VLMDAHDVATWCRTRPGSATWCVRQFVEGQLTNAWHLFHYRNGIRLWAADQVEHFCPGLCPEAAGEAREGLRTSAALQEENGFCPKPQFVNSRLDLLRAAAALSLDDDRTKLVQARLHCFPYLEAYRLGGHLAYLNRIVDWAERQGVPLVLLDMPVSADLDVQLHPKAFATYRTALAELERTRRVRVLRASRDAVHLTDTDFADLIHLNASGAARLSRWLREALEQGESP